MNWIEGTSAASNNIVHFNFTAVQKEWLSEIRQTHQKKTAYLMTHEGSEKISVIKWKKIKWW